MRQLDHPAGHADSPLRRAIRQLSAGPLLTGSLLLVLAPATQALTLGDITVRSALGQPLDAVVPMRLGNGEALTSGCVIPETQGADLRPVPGASISTPQATHAGAYELRVTSAAALYEPMYELQIKVECPGAAMLVRQYVLMLDLPGALTAAAMASAAESTATAPAPPAREASRTALPKAATRRPVATGIDVGTRYRVVTGDTLSGIASRVRRRPTSWQDMAAAIQAANPDAFIHNDANLIKLGSEIVIPSIVPPSSESSGLAAGGSAGVAAAVPAPLAAARPAPTLAATSITKATDHAAVSSPPAAVPLPPAAAPVESASARDIRRTVKVRDRSAAVAPPAATDSSNPSPVVAASSGIAFALLVSALLWFRDRRPARRKTEARPTPGRGAQPFPPATVAAMPAPFVTRSHEPGFSVSYTPAQEDTLAAEFGETHPPASVPSPTEQFVHASPEVSEDITNELVELFDGTDTTIQKRLDDQKKAETLHEALTLLERDYEDELTASQILDMSAVRKAIGSNDDEVTQISATAGRKRIR